MPTQGLHSAGRDRSVKIKSLEAAKIMKITSKYSQILTRFACEVVVIRSRANDFEFVRRPQLQDYGLRTKHEFIAEAPPVLQALLWRHYPPEEAQAKTGAAL